MASRATKQPAKRKTAELELTLSALQVEAIIRQAQRAEGGSFAERLFATLQVGTGTGTGGGARGKAIRRKIRGGLGDSELSQSLLRGLAILACYGGQRRWRSNLELAQALELSPSTVHRYIRTLCAAGLLERDPESRAYRPVAV